MSGKLIDKEHLAYYMVSNDKQDGPTDTAMPTTELASDDADFARLYVSPELGEKLTLLAQTFENAPDGIQLLSSRTIRDNR